MRTESNTVDLLTRVLEAENPGEFSWEYREEGPEAWRVRIGRVASAIAAGRPAS